MEPHDNRQLLWIGLLMAIAMAAYAIYLDTPLRQFQLPPRPSKRELIASGKRSDYYSDLIEKISRDLKLTKSVKLIFVPGGPLFPSGDLVESKFSYHILIGESFFFSLPEAEQRALIAHEMGHVIFVPPVCYDPVNCQAGADLIAALYTSPEAMIMLLKKLSSHPYWTESYEYRIRLEHLRLILPEQGQ